jgi:DNA-binding Lrp family transcriptional regulator
MLSRHKNMNAKPRIDEVDVKILEALLRDARTNFSDIAEECKLSITAITQRYRKMKRKGIIQGTAVLINQDSVKRRFVSIDIKAESDHEKSIIEAIRRLPGVRVCFKVIGKYDIHVSMKAESLEQIEQIKNEIRQQKGVLEVEVTFGLDRICSFPENLSLLPT